MPTGKCCRKEGWEVFNLKDQKQQITSKRVSSGRASGQNLKPSAFVFVVHNCVYADGKSEFFFMIQRYCHFSGVLSERAGAEYRHKWVSRWILFKMQLSILKWLPRGRWQRQSNTCTTAKCFRRSWYCNRPIFISRVSYVPRISSKASLGEEGDIQATAKSLLEPIGIYPRILPCNLGFPFTALVYRTISRYKPKWKEASPEVALRAISVACFDIL